MAGEMHDEGLQRRFRRVGRRIRGTKSYFCIFPQVPRVCVCSSRSETDSVCSGLFVDLFAFCVYFSTYIQFVVPPSSDGQVLNT